MLILSMGSAPLPQVEADKLIRGDPPPKLTDVARFRIESRVLVKSGVSTRLVGALFVTLGMLCLALGFGWFE